MAPMQEASRKAKSNLQTSKRKPLVRAGRDNLGEQPASSSIRRATEFWDEV